MLREYPYGFSVSIEGGQNYRWPITEPKYMELLSTGKAYLSSYTQISPISGIDRSKYHDPMWFNVQPDDQVIYKPP
jgi:hypothetical protein